MNIFSWNTDSLKHEKWLKLKSYILTHQPDIVCLNETKGKYERIEKLFLELEDYDYLINSHKPANMHGVAILIKKSIKWSQITIPISCVSRSETKDPDPCCGRLLGIRLENIYGLDQVILVVSYVPNSGVDWRAPLKNLDYRINIWDPALFGALKKLEDIYTNVIWIGDINVAPKEIDVSHPQKLKKHAGFTIEERTSYYSFINVHGWIDIWRYQHPNTVAYSFKGYSKNSYKLRLDNCLITKSLLRNVSESEILPDEKFLESDHNPIRIKLDFAKKKIIIIKKIQDTE